MTTRQMYKLNVPVMNSNVTDETREQYLVELKRAGVDRVWLAVCERPFAHDHDPERVARISSLKDNIIYFTKHGFEVGVWITTFGYGGAITKKNQHRALDLMRITSVKGVTMDDAMCPMDERFTILTAEFVSEIAKSGTRLIMLDDEMCLSVRPGLGCACDLHMAEYRWRLGEDIRREELMQKVFSGGPSRYRDVWLELMGDTMRDFCRAMRAAVDRVDETVRLGFCAGYTSWDVEGADALELTDILAGRNRGFLRFTGAPYWISTRRFRGQNLQTIIETVRMQEVWCAGKDIEVFHEADSFPRPRYHVPAARLECYDLCLRSSGGMDGLKYLLDYISSPALERGYTDRHVRNMPVFEWISGAFDGKTAVGVRVYETMRKLKAMDLPETYPDDNEGQRYIMTTFFSPAQCLLTSNTIPTTYQGNHNIGIVFGANAKFLDDEALSGNLILDVAAAKILASRGVDVGINETKAVAAMPDREVFPMYREKNYLHAPEGLYLDLSLKKGAEVLSQFKTIEDTEFPAAYTYENGRGQRFLVYAFDGYSIWQNCDVFCSYGRKKQLDDALTWLGGGSMPAVCSGHPGLYMICKKGNGSMAIALCNILEDAIFAPAEVKLGRTYGKARFIGCEGMLEGNKFVLSTDIAPFGFVGIELME